jgi:hypothetical protein
MDSYSIWTLSVLLGFAPWEASGTSLSLLTITLVTVGFSSWRAKIKYLSTFGSWLLRLNNEHPNCLKANHSDNGTEFRNASFDEFCLEHGIDQQFSALCVPQQNGVVERKNSTLVKMARTMLDEHRTPRRF